MMKKILSASFAAAALLALALAPAPAKAQVWNQVDNAVGQSNAVVIQGGLAAAEANSAADNATATALTANIGNSLEVSTAIETASSHMFGYGAVGDKVTNVVNQTNVVGAQIGVSLAQANAQVRAAADATSVNLGNSGSVMNTVKAVTSRH